jgi:circadian clock protein KaiB
MKGSRGPRERDPRVPVRVCLYVAGGSPNSVAALANVRGVLQGHPKHTVTLEVIDIVSDPERGVRDGVLMTPMLVRAEPDPERRVLGTLQDRRLLLEVLGLDGQPHE